MVEGIVLPRDRKEGKGTHPKAVEDLQALLYEIVQDAWTDKDAHHIWKKRFLETPHYASLHLDTTPALVEPITKKFTEQLFIREWERVDVELFSLYEAVITVVDRMLNETDPNAMSS